MNQGKNKLLILIATISVSVLLAAGIGLYFYLTNYSKDSASDTNQFSQNSTSIDKSKKYVEISTDRIGEYTTSEYFLQAEIDPIEISSLGKLNFYNYSYKDQLKTVDFSNSNLKPIKLDVNGFKFSNIEVHLSKSNVADLYQSYQKISATKYNGIVKDMTLELYQKENYYVLIAHYSDGFYWSLSNNIVSNEAVVESEFKQALQCISSEFDATAPLVDTFIKEHFLYLDYDVMALDLQKSEIELNFVLPYVNIFTRDSYAITGIDTPLYIMYGDSYLGISLSSVDNLASRISIETVKNGTNKLYDAKINNTNIRFYEASDGQMVYLGIITDNSEQIMSIKTSNLTIDSLIELLELIIK